MGHHTAFRKIREYFRKLSVASLPWLTLIEKLKVKAHLPSLSVLFLLAKLLNFEKHLPSTTAKRMVESCRYELGHRVMIH